MSQVWQRPYIVLLVLHALHIFEEVYGSAWFISQWYKTLPVFLLIQVVLWLLAVGIFILATQKRAALWLVQGYALIMVIDGMEHIVQQFLRGYWNGSAGLITGLLMIPTGVFLLVHTPAGKNTETSHFIPALRYRFLTPAYDVLAIAAGFGKTFRQRVLAATPIKGNVLDIGCGTGTATRLIKEHYPQAAVYGIDIDPAILNIAKRKAAKAGLTITYQQGNAEKLPFPDAFFDVVTSTLMFHHLKRPTKEGMLQEVRRILKPKGTFVLADFGKPMHWFGHLFGWFTAHVEHGKENIAGQLPALIRAAGFRKVRLLPRPRYNVDVIVAER